MLVLRPLRPDAMVTTLALGALLLAVIVIFQQLVENKENVDLIRVVAALLLVALPLELAIQFFASLDKQGE